MFGLWLRQYRRRLDISRVALAKRINYSPSMITKVETRERIPSLLLVKALAEVLAIPNDLYASFEAFARRGQWDESLARLGVIYRMRKEVVKSKSLVELTSLLTTLTPIELGMVYNFVLHSLTLSVFEQETDGATDWVI